MVIKKKNIETATVTAKTALEGTLKNLAAAGETLQTAMVRDMSAASNLRSEAAKLDEAVESSRKEFDRITAAAAQVELALVEITKGDK